MPTKAPRRPLEPSEAPVVSEVALPWPEAVESPVELPTPEPYRAVSELPSEVDVPTEVPTIVPIPSIEAETVDVTVALAVVANIA